MYIECPWCARHCLGAGEIIVYTIMHFSNKQTNISTLHVQWCGWYRAGAVVIFNWVFRGS